MERQSCSKLHPSLSPSTPQGTLLFVGLLLLLWVPLLVFSSGNPTYQVPAVVGFGVNVTLVGKPVPGTNAKHRTSTRSFPLFAAGDRRVAGEWGGDQAMLGPGMTDYEASQFQLLCASPVGACEFLGLPVMPACWHDHGGAVVTRTWPL